MKDKSKTAMPTELETSNPGSFGGVATSDTVGHQDECNDNRVSTRAPGSGTKSSRAICRATGPRTVRGKQISSRNAVTHGILASVVLLPEESRSKYSSLLLGLQEGFQPQGMMEHLLVEKLATTVWRYRRLLIAERAEIQKAIGFTDQDRLRREALQIEDLVDSGTTMHGMVHYLNAAYNPYLLDRIIEIWKKLLEDLEKRDFDYGLDFRVLRKVHGRLRLESLPSDLQKDVLQIARNEPNSSKPMVVQSNDTKGLRAIFQEVAEYGIAQLERKKKGWKHIEEMQTRYAGASSSIPPPHVTEILMRYEAQLNRELEQLMNQLERLQRTRLGQPAPPQIDVKISS